MFLPTYVDYPEDFRRIPLQLQVLATLNFFASGSHQRRVGMDAFAVMSQSSILRDNNYLGNFLKEKIIFQFYINNKTHIVF